MKATEPVWLRLLLNGIAISFQWLIFAIVPFLAIRWVLTHPSKIEEDDSTPTMPNDFKW